MIFEGAETVEATVRAVLRDVLGIDEARVAGFDAQTELFGSLPELEFDGGGGPAHRTRGPARHYRRR